MGYSLAVVACAACLEYAPLTWGIMPAGWMRFEDAVLCPACVDIAAELAERREREHIASLYRL